MRWMFSLFAIGCGDDAPGGVGPPVLEPKPPGLESDPRWLTYTCVEPGCDTALTARVKVIGSRDVAVKRIVLSDRDRPDFEVTASEEPPFILEVGSELAIDVRYRPDGDPRLGDVDLRVTFTDASASESDDRIPPGELAIPLVRRLIGEPKLEVDPAILEFGPVLPTTEKALALGILNTGFGNVGLVIDRIDVDPATEVHVGGLPEAALVPGERAELSVVYRPLGEAYLDGTLTLYPVAEIVVPTVVPLIGTSIPHPSLLPEPAAVDFGEVAVGGTAIETLTLINRGAEDLVIQRVELGGAITGGTLEIELAGGSTTATIAALASANVTLELTAVDPGEIDTFVRITSNDTEQPVVDVPVTGLMTKPIIAIAPVGLDFGAVPRGWTLVQSIEVSNSGFGDLEITNLGLILGSSELFTVRTVPSLPMVLRHDQRFGIEIEFRSEAEAVFNGTLSIDSNDVDRPFVEIPITATGASCADGCPIANGTPDCGSGLCEVGMCDLDWYDADGDPATGCECREIGNDPGEFCAEGVYLGSVGDDGDRASYTGILPSETDVDVIRFFGNDGFQFGSDDYDVRVTMESTDPGIQFCVYRHETGDHLSECFWENERCTPDRAFRHDGSSGPTDSSDYSVKVFRDPTIPPTCTSYTLFIRNG
jgi:hypothetical protein